jgi:probable rRNA maturation factor
MPDGDEPSFRRAAARRAADGRRPARLRVRVSDESGAPAAARGLSRWLQRVAPARARGVVSVALVSDARVRALNRAYRNKDYATDVLSFPADERRRGGQGRRPILPPVLPLPPFLGDIVIARGVLRRQAREARHSELTEMKVLALHGLLHLLGYDHERDGGEMQRLERRLRRKGGLGAGLIDREMRAGGGRR